MSNERLHPEKGLVRSGNPNVWIAEGYAARARKIPTTDLREVYAAVIDDTGAESLRRVLTPSNWRQRFAERYTTIFTQIINSPKNLREVWKSPNRQQILVTAFVRAIPSAESAGIIAADTIGIPTALVLAHLNLLNNSDLITLPLLGFALGGMSGIKLHEVCSRLVQHPATGKLIQSTENSLD